MSFQICICAGSERRRSGEGSCKSSSRWRRRRSRLSRRLFALSATTPSSRFVPQLFTFQFYFPSSDTWHHHQVKESIAREAACRELERQGEGEAGEGRREREGEEGRRDEERPNLPPSPHSPPHSRPSPSLPQYSLSSQVSPFFPFSFNKQRCKKWQIYLLYSFQCAVSSVLLTLCSKHRSDRRVLLTSTQKSNNVTPPTEPGY